MTGISGRHWRRVGRIPEKRTRRRAQKQAEKQAEEKSEDIVAEKSDKRNRKKLIEKSIYDKIIPGMLYRGFVFIRFIFNT